jgi:3-oxoacyl-[acyl-carrier-protein] synthase-3
MRRDEVIQHYVEMQGRDIFKIAVQKMSEAVDEIMLVNKDAVKQLDWLVPHQANLRIISTLAKRLALPMDRVILTIEQQANTSGASIPLALDFGVRSGKIRPGHSVLMEGFGGGLTWGSALVTM